MVNKIISYHREPFSPRSKAFIMELNDKKDESNNPDNLTEKTELCHKLTIFDFYQEL